MIFESLYEASLKGKLLLVEGGMCHFNPRRDGQLTILEIIVLPEKQGQGVAYNILKSLLSQYSPQSVFAKCPKDLARANAWYARQGFKLETVEKTKTGRELNCWRLYATDLLC